MVLLLGASFSPAVAKDYSYVTNHGEITITGYRGPGGEVVIPGTLDGYPVTALDWPGFSYRTNVSRVVVPDSVRAIGDSVFYECANLVEVRLGSGVVRLGDFSFARCPNLAVLNLPETIRQIGRSAFNQCHRLTAVTLPPGLTEIQGYTFYACQSLTRLKIPDQVTQIGDSAFAFCDQLAEITLGSAVNRLGSDVFYYCDRLQAAYFLGAAPEIRTNTFTVAKAVTLYRLPGAAGWTSSLGGHPTAIWALPYPVILTAPPGISLGPLGFSFIVSWAAHDSVTIEAASNAVSGPWTSVASLPLTDGWGTFTTPAGTTPPVLFYRARAP